ncbi:MAG: LysR family transcriptional regulator, partial [Lachnospiraceae bacterium]|nr:LysR family transcriptional regulator [Lachnospiraceae bacterium]
MEIEVIDRYIPVIAAEGTISAAARKLGLSQPAVSLALTQLEKKLGFSIFDRQSSPLKPTPAGRIYISYLNRQAMLISDCFKEISELNGSAGYELKLGASAIYTEALLLPSMISFRNEHKQSRFKLITAHQKELSEKTLNGELDGFISTSSDLPAPLKAEFIKNEKLFFCSITESGGQDSRFGLTDESELIFMEDDQPLQKAIKAFLTEHNINCRNYITVNQVSSSLRLMEAGKGTSLLSEDACSMIRDKEHAFIKQLPDKYSSRNLYFAYNADRYL